MTKYLEPIEVTFFECPFCDGKKYQTILPGRTMICLGCKGSGEFPFIPPTSDTQALFTIYPKRWDGRG